MSERLKIAVVGASGTLGSAVVDELKKRHDIIKISRKSGDIHADFTDVESLQSAFQKMGKINAVVCAAGEVQFLPLEQFKAAHFTESHYALGLKNKLMGQVNLALIARDYLLDGGSITLTSGILAEQPIAAGTSASMVNGALEAFVLASAIELKRGLRINIVSPNVLVESMDGYAPFFRGFDPVPAAKAALAFSRSVEGLQTGQVYRVF
jgi:NAD(P)-dependent dehydrogenase (short-subunit alcohol dehydrogenase family)